MFEGGLAWWLEGGMSEEMTTRDALRDEMLEQALTEVERLRGVLSQVAHDLGDEGYAHWSREVYDQIGAAT